MVPAFLVQPRPPRPPLSSALDATHIRLDPLSPGSWAGDGTPSFGTPSPFLIHPLLGRSLKQDRSLGSAEISAQAQEQSVVTLSYSHFFCCLPLSQRTKQQQQRKLMSSSTKPLPPSPPVSLSPLCLKLIENGGMSDISLPPLPSYEGGTTSEADIQDGYGGEGKSDDVHGTHYHEVRGYVHVRPRSCGGWLPWGSLDLFSGIFIFSQLFIFLYY